MARVTSEAESLTSQLVENLTGFQVYSKILYWDVGLTIVCFDKLVDCVGHIHVIITKQHETLGFVCLGGPCHTQGMYAVCLI